MRAKGLECTQLVLNLELLGVDPNPHPKSLSLRERNFESGSLLPWGEGLGMRAVNLRKKGEQMPTLKKSDFNR
jgi:hypothetical protein